ncbi:HNH endonuclease signature motif containing protein [Nocardioides speluncae]|uniref:HNH endonuclease signature motif containing protein n=1 Tax=Nocardioides speluncae TaxID=2670337 RepID=UPI001F0BF3D7|nr:HNH endonuclease signature motif containing protein [Nocardioides speluncae]
MSGPGAVSAWLLMTVGENRQHGGNAGYDDQADVYYTWDSTVPNHARIKVGDPIAVWDKERLLGLSVIEEIVRETKEKLLFKCPYCGKAGIKQRVVKSPRFKCYKCSEEFETPHALTATVVEYRSRHDAAWTSLDGLLPGDALRQLCDAPRSQLSMRQLRWDDFREAVTLRGADRAVDRVAHRAPGFFVPQGHHLETVRVRRGQRQFREHLLAAQGEVCAFTGDTPPRVLEAGHLYSYAELGEHHEHGGLLLRRDIHRLFDDGWLAVDPGTLRVDVSDSLEAYPQYATLHDQTLRTCLRDPQVEWLAHHWAEHRAS